MARPKKVGLEYFPLDCRMNDKVEILEAEHGLEGFAVYIKLLQEIYQTADGKLDMSVVFRWKTFGKRYGIDSSRLENIVTLCLEIDLFDKNEYESTKNLTSAGVQSRLGKVSDLRNKDRARKTDENGEFSGSFPAENNRIPLENIGKSTQKEKEREKESNSKNYNSSSSADNAGAIDDNDVISLDAEEMPPTPPVARAPLAPERFGDGRLQALVDAFAEKNPNAYTAEMYRAFLKWYTKPFADHSQPEKVGLETWLTYRGFEIEHMLLKWHERDVKRANESTSNTNNGSARTYAGTKGGNKGGYGKPGKRTTYLADGALDRVGADSGNAN